MALTPPTEEEMAQRGHKQMHVGVTNKEVARRIAAMYGDGKPVRNWSPSRVKNLQAGASRASLGDYVILARVLDVPEEFFTLSRPELLGRIRGEAVQAIPGATGRRAGALRPSREDQPQPESHEEEGHSHGEP